MFIVFCMSALLDSKFHEDKARPVSQLSKWRIDRVYGNWEHIAGESTFIVLEQKNTEM